MVNHPEPAPESYQAYLLRIWLESWPGADGPPPDWRFSLEDARSGTRRGFTSLETLADYLRELLSGSPDNG